MNSGKLTLTLGTVTIREIRPLLSLVAGLFSFKASFQGTCFALVLPQHQSLPYLINLLITDMELILNLNLRSRQKIFFLGIALSLRKANFVSRNIGL